MKPIHVYIHDAGNYEPGKNPASHQRGRGAVPENHEARAQSFHKVLSASGWRGSMEKNPHSHDTSEYSGNYSHSKHPHHFIAVGTGNNISEGKSYYAHFKPQFGPKGKFNGRHVTEHGKTPEDLHRHLSKFHGA